MTENPSENLDTLAGKCLAVKRELQKVILGQEQMLEEMLITLICRGHALLEGVPGTAKTLAVRALAQTISCETRRIQFTPDLMPSDIVGTNVFNLQHNRFDLRKGPIFTDLLLGDEINRAPAKTQSAMLEGMSEGCVTIDGVRYELSPIFTVFATQNPIEYEGTYPLPEAQLDRFLLKIRVEYPSEESERSILSAIDQGHPPDRLTPETLAAVFSVPELQQGRMRLADVRIDPGILDYLLKLVRATREHSSILVGAGPRGSIALLSTAKGRALINGRDFVIPDDVVALIRPALGHRITLSAEAEIEGATADEILRQIMDQTEVPR